MTAGGGRVLGFRLVAGRGWLKEKSRRDGRRGGAHPGLGEGLGGGLLVDGPGAVVHAEVVNTLSPAAIVSALLISQSLIFAASVGPRFYGDPPDAHHPWAVHDGNRPQPKRVTPGTFSTPAVAGQPPSDAIILFDGKDLSKWQNDKGEAPKWKVENGYMEVTPGSGQIKTREQFGDCQLHIEWAAPAKVEGDSQGRGNSGVFFMGMLEIQVLDSYDNATYADGHAGAYYGINPPMVLPVQPPGTFQVYDIVFRRPIYKDGQVVDPGYVTVFVNGVLVQDHTPLEGSGTHMARTRPGPFPEKGPLALQDHGNPMRFRNIWYRELAPRPSQGGTDGYLTAEAALAKRQQIAEEIRKDAVTLKSDSNPLPEMMRWFESLVYAKDDEAARRAEELARAYLKGLASLSSADLENKKDEVKHVRDVFKYLAKWKMIPADFGPKQAVDEMIAAKGWDRQQRR